jgi:hypothetical protein
MKADDLIGVMREMEMLFVEYSMSYAALLNEKKAPELTFPSTAELQRAFAKKAADVVFKHCAWPHRLADQLDRVMRYIEANPTRGNPNA